LIPAILLVLSILLALWRQLHRDRGRAGARA
jgi:hypothetical protein